MQCQPTDSRAAHLAGPQSCAPNYAAGPQLPNYAAGPQLPCPITQLAHKPSPTRHQTMANPPQPAPNLPKRFPNFRQPRQNSEVYEPLRKSPTFSKKPRVSLHLVCGRPQVSPYFLSKPRTSHPICSRPRVSPPLGSQRSQLSRAGFNRSPVTFHTQVSSDAQFRASASNPQSLRLHTAPTLHPHRAHTAPAQRSVVHLLQPA